MTGFLLDTNVLSEFSYIKEPNPAVKKWLTSVENFTLYVSVLTLAEIQKGIELMDQGKRRTILEQWFDDYLRPNFANRVLPISEAVAGRWASLTVSLQNRGRILPPIDGLIAATGLEHKLIVVTRDVSDFKETGVKLVNPWDFLTH